MKNIVVLYHKDCPDGFGAAWAAWKKFGDKADYVAIEYKNPPPPELKNKEIYLVDFGYNQKELMKKLLVCNKRMVMIDHHISRKNILPILPEYSFDVNHSGAVLAWRYFHPNKAVPKLLLYVEDEDLWRFKLPLARELTLAIQSYDYNFTFWNKMAADFENPSKRKKYAEEGRAILKLINKTIEILVAEGDEVIFEKNKALAVNSPVFASEIGEYIVRKKGYPIGIIWHKDGNGIRFQLRSSKRVDVSKLAQKYGGGGHKRAAGFYLKKTIKLPWKIIKNA
jgi:nanoRNase/pAp phosphatase (c-di-AMP/oligoRNAs hydrolase)